MIPKIFAIILGERGVVHISSENKINWNEEIKNSSLFNIAGYTLDAILNKTNQVNTNHLKEVKDHVKYLVKIKVLEEKEIKEFDDWVKANTLFQ